MGNNSSSFVGFDFVKQEGKSVCLINTLPAQEQDCLIVGTVPACQETDLVNQFIQDGIFSKQIVLYGKNHHDKSVLTKHSQLKKLGFSHVYMYSGGLFEWLLLQDVYGTESFPTTKAEDLLKYKY